MNKPAGASSKRLLLKNWRRGWLSSCRSRAVTCLGPQRQATHRCSRAWPTGVPYWLRMACRCGLVAFGTVFCFCEGQQVWPTGSSGYGQRGLRALANGCGQWGLRAVANGCGLQVSCLGFRYNKHTLVFAAELRRFLEHCSWPSVNDHSMIVQRSQW